MLAIFLVAVHRWLILLNELFSSLISVQINRFCINNSAGPSSPLGLENGLQQIIQFLKEAGTIPRLEGGWSATDGA